MLRIVLEQQEHFHAKFRLIWLYFCHFLIVMVSWYLWNFVIMTNVLMANGTCIYICDTIYNWTTNDHSLKVNDIIWQDLGSLSFYFSVSLSALCMPQFWSHKLDDPYLGCIYVQLDTIKRIFWKKKHFYLKFEKTTFFPMYIFYGN